MKTIKVLGTGCANCKTTEAIIKKVAENLNIEVNIVKVEDIQDIMAYDVMSTPAVVIDEKVIIKGKVPSEAEIEAFLKENKNGDTSCCSSDSEDNSNNCCS